MIGEVHKVYPREGVERMNVQGHIVTSAGTPLTITKQLVAMQKAHFIRIDEGMTDQPVTPVPSPAPTPAPAPAPDPHALDVDTPTADQAPSDDDRRRAKLAELNRMDNEELRAFVHSIGENTEGKRRGSLLHLASQYVKNLPADKLV